MDKPINQITNIKPLEQLKTYLEERSQLNLSILTDKSNNTLLHFSSFKNDLPRIKIFIKHFKEFTEAHHGVGLYMGNFTFSEKLKAWVNASNKEGYIPLFYAGLHGNLQMLQFLEECGSNMQFRSTKNQNILFMCVEHNRIKLLIYFLEPNESNKSKYNYDIDQGNITGDTILHHASAKGYTQIVSYLLSLGANMEAVNQNGDTPLIAATKQLKKEVVKLLLIKGANRKATNKNEQNALQIAKNNNKEDLIRTLDDNFGCWDKFKIKCNKKIVYAPQKSSYSYSIYFMVLFHLFFLPANLLSQYKISEKYVKFIPLMFQGLYQLVIFLLYCLLLRKQKKKRPQTLNQIQGNFCAECKRELNNKIFHCYICERCVYRYDHHCPWINNCVGSHNIGKFTVFLFILLLGLMEVTFCSVCLLIGDGQDFISYRKAIEVPDWIHMPLNIATIFFSAILGIGLINLLVAQFHNLFTNQTSFERQKRPKEMKKEELLTSELSMNDSIDPQIEEDSQKGSFRCLCNCIDILSQKY